jgi:hypothetical protein
MGDACKPSSASVKPKLQDHVDARHGEATKERQQSDE